jgi:hypothetical protein
MREGREGLLPVVGVALKAFQDLGQVQRRIDLALETMNPLDPEVKAVEQLALGIERVRQRFGDVIRDLPEAVYNCWIEDVAAAKVKVYLTLGVPA